MSDRTTAADVFDQLADIAEDAPAAETAETAEAPAAEADPDGGAGRPRRLRRRAVAVLIGLVVAASLGSAAYWGWQVRQLNATAAAADAAIAAAKDYVFVLTTMNAKDIDAHYEQALDGATGRFKDEYAQGAAQLRQILVDNDAAGNGVVLDAAVKSATRTKVEVLLFVDQSITNVINPSPRIDRNRVQMTMERIDNRWLASNVDLI